MHTHTLLDNCPLFHGLSPQEKAYGLTYFDARTKAAVMDFQTFASLPPNGEVNDATWDAIYDRFAGIENTVLNPGTYLAPITSFPGQTLQTGMRD